MDDRLIRLNDARKNMYRFLSRVFMLEIDDTFYHRLKDADFPLRYKDEDMETGCALVRKWLEEHGDQKDDYDLLAADYARVFLAAGIAQGQAAFPYESVYTGKKHQVMEECAGQMDHLYAQMGIKPSENMFKVPSDHIALELEYMAKLCTNSSASVEDQREYFFSHLNPWVPVFCSEVIKYSETDFYKGIAKFTKGFITMEAHLLKGGTYELLSEQCTNG